MAADDELPRGWVQTNYAGGGNAPATVTYPAIPGISWVLTSAAGQWFYQGGGTANANVQLTAGADVLFNGGVEGPNGSSGEGDWSGSLQFPVSTGFTVTANTLGGGYSAVEASAYPI